MKALDGVARRYGGSTHDLRIFSLTARDRTIVSEMSTPREPITPPESPLSEVPITPAVPQQQRQLHDADATFAHEIFTLIGHEDVTDITVLQAEMFVSDFDFFVFSGSCLTVFSFSLR
jgi:hypothetical protein